MMMKVIASKCDKKSSTLELCSLNDTLVNFNNQKKDYAFFMLLPLTTIMCLLSIMTTDLVKLILKYSVSLYLHIARIYSHMQSCTCTYTELSVHPLYVYTLYICTCLLIHILINTKLLQCCLCNCTCKSMNLIPILCILYYFNLIIPLVICVYNVTQ